MWWLAGGALRRRWVGVVVAAAVAALLFGGAASALVGARRSSTAVDRFLAFGPPEDLYVSAPDGVRLDMAAVARLPQVLAAAHQSYLALVPIGPDGRPQLDRVGSINPYLYAPVVGPPDAIARRRILRGRDLDPTKSLEVVIDEELAADRHLGVGGRLLMAAYRGDQMAVALSSGAVIPPPKGPRLALDVVGIARTPSDIHPGEDAHTTSFGGTKDIYLTPALFRRYGARLAVYDPPVLGSPVAIRLVHGAADAAGFTAAVRRLPGGSQALIETGGSDALDSARTARRAIAVETGALVVLAALLAASGTVLVGQASSRLARSLTGDLATLRALGLRPIELLAVAAAPALGAVGLAVVGGVGVALVTSPLTPIGLAHQADVTPGFHVDPAILATGAAVTLAVGGVLAVLTARGAVRSILAPSGGAARSRPGVATRLARWRAPLAPTMGARFATEPRTGERAAPVRSAVVTTTIGLAALVGVGTYAASLEQLAARPGAQGANWDVTIGNPNLSAYRPADVRRLDADPRVAAVAAVASPQGRATVDGLDVTLAGVDGATAEVGPLPIRGRLPNARGEIALGRRTARRLRVQIGDRVTAAMNGRSQRLTVVGTALLNPGLAPTMQLGDGALTSIAQVRALLPDQPITFLLARLAPGQAVGPAIRGLMPTWGRNVSAPPRPTDVVNLQRVKGIPRAFAAALGVAALLLLGLALLIATRARRRDLAVLWALGSTRRQITSMLVWEGVWLYAAAALVGVPAGVILGRWIWQQVADGIGTLLAPTVPVADIVLVTGVGLAAVSLVTVLTAVVGRPARPAEGLRAG